MISFAVTFITYMCPGTIAFLGFNVALARLPESAKPALAVAGVCEAVPTVELYDTARYADARARVLSLGKPARLQECDGVLCGKSLVTWSSEATFKERQ